MSPVKKTRKPERPKIIARLVHRWQKNLLLKEARAKKLKITDLGVQVLARNIFVSKHLTPWQQGVFKRARDLKRSGFVYAGVGRDDKI